VRSIPLLCALLLAAVLLFLAALHVYWAMGGNWGSAVTVPTIAGRRVINPTPFATYVVAFLLVMAALIICGQANLFATGRFSALFYIGSWCLCGVFLLRTMGDFNTFGIFKTVHGTALLGHASLFASMLRPGRAGSGGIRGARLRITPGIGSENPAHKV
jgi:hypothetical protein